MTLNQATEDGLIDSFRVKLGFCCGCFLSIPDDACGSNLRQLTALFLVRFFFAAPSPCLGDIIMLS